MKINIIITVLSVFMFSTGSTFAHNDDFYANHHHSISKTNYTKDTHSNKYKFTEHLL